MKSADLTITVPAEIVALPNLSLVELVALAHLYEWPGSSNARLAKRLGLSERGIEAMLRRLRQRGLIQQHGKGHARVLRLMFPVEHHTECGENTLEASHKKCGAKPQEAHILSGMNPARNAVQAQPNPAQTTSTATTGLPPSKYIEREMELAGECAMRWEFDDALRRYAHLKDYIANLNDTDSELKAMGLEGVSETETRILAVKLVFDYARSTNLPKDRFNALTASIASLSEERLAEIRPTLDAQAQLAKPVDISALLVDETGHRL